MNENVCLASVQFKNYRAFKDQGTINLNKLTLLFGYNNAGKSALIRLLPFLADSFKTKESHEYTKSYMDYTSSSLRGALFEDIKHKNARKMHFGVKWSNDVGVDFTLQQDGMDPETLSELIVSKGSEVRTYEMSIDAEGSYENVKDKSDVIQLSSFDRIGDADLKANIIKYSGSVHWVSSTRVHPPREFEIGIGVEIGVKPDGSGVGETIWHLSEKNSASFVDINNWLSKTCNRHFEFKSSSSVTSAGRRKVKLETVIDETGALNSALIKIPILDSGEGIAQALPVVTICAMAANRELGECPIVVIEQPELHLHPKAIVVLANYIVECTEKNSDARILVETHSESFLLALQTAIIDKKLSVNDFSCYWVGMENNGSYIKRVGFDNEGYIVGNWPQSVFRETVNQSKELLKKRRKLEM